MKKIVPAGDPVPLIEDLVRLAVRVHSNASIAAVLGQADDLDNIADGIEVVVGTLKTWEGIRQLLMFKETEMGRLVIQLEEANREINDQDMWAGMGDDL